MIPRSLAARLGFLIAVAAAMASPRAATADVLHAVYKVSLIGLPIGAANLNAELTPTRYSIAADAKLTGLAKIISNARGASRRPGRDRRRQSVPRDLRHHRRELEYDAHHSHGAGRQHRDGR